ncbi:MAG TPA: sugar ABC transporter permease [Anaerolineae bacterium]|nr:sugar ABC transporter permease [Anaerolineae bacterium]HQH39893.1 sugar ABC transporter permease [Anaerolineae bacterium]
MNKTSHNGSVQGVVSTLTRQFRTNIQTYAIIMAMIFIWILFTIATGGLYLSPQNISNLIRQMTVTSFLACGMVLVIVTGGIDLGVGKVAGFVSVIVAQLQANIWHTILPDQELLTTILSVIAGLSVGTLVGAIEGYIVSYLAVPAFIVTLGSQWAFNGGILIVTQGKTIPANQPLFSWIGQGYLNPATGWIVAAGVIALLFYTMFNGRQKKRRYGFELSPLYMDILKTALYSVLIVAYVAIVNSFNGVSIPVLLLAIVAVVMSYVSNNTRFGRYAYAIGGNREAARLSGVNIKKNIFTIFVVMGLLCGVSGVVLASYIGYGTVAAGQGYELDAIASCILGGTSTLGGEGTVFGAMIGSLIMASLTNGLQILNVPSSWQYVVKGIVLILAVYMDVYFKKNR